MLFRDPISRGYVRVPDKYDNEEYISPETRTNNGKRKEFQDVTPTNLLSRTGYNYNHASTKKDEHRAVTLKLKKASAVTFQNPKGLRRKRRRVKNY